MVALIGIALLLFTSNHKAAAQPATPLTLQPETVPCIGKLVLKTNQPSPPKDVSVAVNGHSVQPELTGQRILIPIQVDGDCGNGSSLTVTAGSFTQTYLIDHGPAPTPSDNSNQHPDDQAALIANVQSLRDTVLLYGGIAAIAIFASCLLLLWIMLALRRHVLVLRPSPSNDSDPLSAKLDQIDRTLRERFQDLKAGIAAIPVMQRTEERAPRPEPPPVQERTPDSVVKRSGAALPAPAPSFMDIYEQLSSGQPDSLPTPVIVNFRNPETLDRSPDQSEPLVRDNNGTLIILEHDSLPKGKYYLAPLPEFKGNWTETHTRRWRSLFEFTTPKAMKMVEPAVVRVDGAEWLVDRKGKFA